MKCSQFTSSRPIEAEGKGRFGMDPQAGTPWVAKEAITLQAPGSRCSLT